MYKYAADTYDEINIGGGVREVTIDTCHFNVNALAGLGTSNPPRSAVSLAPGAANVTLNDVSCPSATFCAVAGSSANRSGRQSWNFVSR